MNRTLGFFLGSAVVFVMLVLILGQPVTLAPPADRDPLTRFDTVATTQSARLTQPEIPSDVPSSPQATLQPVQELPAPSPAAKQTPPVQAAPDAVPPPDSMTATVSDAAPAGIGQQDENMLVESWLATAAARSTDNVDATVATAVGETTTVAGADSAPAVVEAPETEWFPLWDPFHSELSANAFARRLERVTGLDYRVIKTDPAQYRVTVGYTSEEQRIANLNLIEEATGLTVTGGSL